MDSVLSWSVLCCALLFSGAASADDGMAFPARIWEETAPESQKLDATRLRTAIDYLKQNAGGDGVRELVIVRNGRLVWKGDAIDKLHGIWSCTKSFTSTTLGLLIDDGKCTLDTPAKQFVPELAEHFGDVTLRHFATMTSGYRAVGDQPRGGYSHGPSKTPFRPLDKPLFSPPGSQYAYWDSAMNMFGLALTRAAGEPLENLFKRRISDPIGMNGKAWDWGDYATVDGVVVNGGSGNGGKHVTISAREMARLGHLFLNRGKWDGKQLISAGWIDAATSVQVPAGTPLGHRESNIDGRGVYGFNWWANGVKPDGQRIWPDAPTNTFAASGHNNNKLFVIPDWNMVIVRLGLDEKDGKISDAVWSEFLRLVGVSRIDGSGTKSASNAGKIDFRVHEIARPGGGKFAQTSAVDVDNDGELDFHAQESATAAPHVLRQGANLIANPSIRSKANWNYLRDAEYDGSTSRSDDGSGSMKLKTPLPNASMALSELISVQPGEQYTYGFYFKTKNGPTFVGAQISLHDSNRKFLRNFASGSGGTSRDGEWQEYALPFVVPENVAFIGCQTYKTYNTRPNGVVWADDFYLGEGLGLDQPPSPKKPFDGAHVRVDALGNFEVKTKGVWTPIFPLCMYSDNYRDWSVYSRQGWNTIIWTGAATQVKQAKEAVSDFNPNGMLAGFSISQYTMPGGYAYNNLADLRTKLKEIFDQGLGDNLLLYYWDNELHHEQWQVPLDVTNTIKSIDVDDSGKRLHPIYVLQGTFNNARVHAARDVIDVSGTYFGGRAADTGRAGPRGDEGLFILDRLEKQTSPAAFAQFNGVDGAGDMRLRLYNSILVGAKAMGYWRDLYGPNLEKDDLGVSRADEKPWWPDFPNLRREVDGLLPIIREPHWTAWKASVDAPNNVRVGTRVHKGEGYLILVNQTTAPQTLTVSLSGLPYSPKEVRDYFDGKAVAPVRQDSFSITIPMIGIGTGTTVLRVAKE